MTDMRVRLSSESAPMGGALFPISNNIFRKHCEVAGLSTTATGGRGGRRLEVEGLYRAVGPGSNR